MIAFRALTHIFFALNIALAVKLPHVWFPLIAFGAVLPDIDCEFSPVGREMGFVSHIFGRHRTMTHSFLATAVVGFVSIPTAIGYGTHIMVDLLNPTGCQLFYPLNKWVKFGIMRSGGFLEVIFRTALIGLFFFNLFPTALR